MGIMVGIAVCVGNKAVATAPSEVEPTGIMTFADPAMQALCAKTWGDGTNITYEQAREVTEIPSSFAEGNVNVKSFMEFVYFTSVTVMMTATFRNCVNFHSILLPKNLQKLTKTNFEKTIIEKIILPDSVTTIGESAFYGCSALTSINIPDSVTTIGEYAFNQCSALTNAKLSNNQTNISSYLFFGCSNLTSVIIGINTKYIWYQSFNSSGLKSVEIPNSVLRIEEGAFSRCVNLASIKLSNSIIFIGYAGFSSGNLSNIILPESLNSLGAKVFYNNKNLSVVRSLNATPPSIGSDCFLLTSPELKIYVPDESVEAYKTATNWSAYANKILPLSQYIG